LEWKEEERAVRDQEFENTESRLQLLAILLVGRRAETERGSCSQSAFASRKPFALLERFS